eukprot:TRINITY_DN5828_c0_g1_i1.p4 TRINITY_DN5828_c0_g1~~TRINITY_DN5828_c0_g1_i1.p4  ORF type:complete len:130 (-),score=3.33 TRINITY_DN5828_c0_g1_i1:548-937(-)
MSKRYINLYVVQITHQIQEQFFPTNEPTRVINKTLQNLTTFSFSQKKQSVVCRASTNLLTKKSTGPSNLIVLQSSNPKNKKQHFYVTNKAFNFLMDFQKARSSTLNQIQFFNKYLIYSNQEVKRNLHLF